MRAFAFLTLVAFASAMTGDFRPSWTKTLLDQQIQRQLFENQVRGSRADFIGVGRSGFEGVDKQTVAQELCDRVAQLVQNFARDKTSGDVELVAQSVADGIKQLIIEAKQTEITKTIEKLQSQQWRGLQAVKTAASDRVIKYLKQQLYKAEQEKGTVVSNSLENLRKTLEVVIEAQLTAERSQKSFSGVTHLSNIVDRRIVPGVSQLTSTAFLAKLQKLVIQYYIQGIQK